jgi:hypothetical protein
MNVVRIRRTTDLLERSILALVIAAAVLGWRLPWLPRLLDQHQAISVVLAILVFASTMTIPAGSGLVDTVGPPKSYDTDRLGLLTAPSMDASADDRRAV